MLVKLRSVGFRKRRNDLKRQGSRDHRIICLWGVFLSHFSCTLFLLFISFVCSFQLMLMLMTRMWLHHLSCIWWSFRNHQPIYFLSILMWQCSQLTCILVDYCTSNLLFQLNLKLTLVSLKLFAIRASHLSYYCSEISIFFTKYKYWYINYQKFKTSEIFCVQN